MKYSLFIITIILFPLGTFCQEWKNFTDTAGNFTATYPSSWTNKIKEGNRVFFTSPADGDTDKFYENINISVSYDKIYAATRIKDMFPAVSDQLAASFRDYKEESLHYFKWNKADAAELIYSGYSKSDDSLKVRVTQWFCFNKSKLYVVTFVSEEAKNNYDKTAREIMSGIVF